MKVVRDADGVIVNAAVLTVADVVLQRVKCPGCQRFTFEKWPAGWDGHAQKCYGLNDGSHEARKTEFKERFADLFRR